MNPLLTTKAESFRSGSDNLEFYHNRLVKLTNGVLMFCSGGEAEITIDLEKHHIIPNTNIMLLPGSILSLRLIDASAAIYADRENQFRESIAQNLLQIFFLDTYDKVQRYFTKEQLEGGNRKGQLFKKFIHLVHTNCTALLCRAALYFYTLPFCHY